MNGIDWRDFGVVNEVRSQGSCGSCWAFMTAAQIETQYAISYGPLHRVSEQHMVDCVENAYGCNGGYFGSVYRRMLEKGALLDKNYHPYANE